MDIIRYTGFNVAELEQRGAPVQPTGEWYANCSECGIPNRKLLLGEGTGLVIDVGDYLGFEENTIHLLLNGGGISPYRREPRLPEGSEREPEAVPDAVHGPTR